ncbi:MutS-like protein [Melghirimyces profundicolus]|uniref:MutS-like protein n=1 Tax=Melghirimyces profundicolus TaxID=1242148 RepID=A0A2T6C2E0_9BACL|nr:hypothetical protein [Melghirimyces profundicolus]PTX62468.1 MutS-like protein [Melghirimyces profundicolus]
MDDLTRRALRWEDVWSKFRPRTPMGQRAKESLPPFMPGEESEWQEVLTEQQQLLQAFGNDPAGADRVDYHLSRLTDPTGVIRMLESGEVPKVSDWFRVKTFLWHGEKLSSLIRKAVPRFRMETAAEEWASALRLLNPAPSLGPSFSLSDDFDSRLKALRRAWEEEDRRVRETAERTARDVERDFPLRRNGEGEWVVDRRSGHLPALERDSRIRRVRETPFDAVFRPVSTPKRKEALRRREIAAARLEAVQGEVLEGLAASFRSRTGFLTRAVEEMGRLDLQRARAELAKGWGGVRPEPDPDVFRIVGGVHPAVAASLESKGRRFSPVDVTVLRGATVIIGPNMGGKTVTLTTVGFIAALGQYGFLVPARSCSMPLVPWIVGIIGDAQETRSGLSTFGAEVRRIVGSLERGSDGLLLIDEPGRGTNPVEGGALAAALTRHLAKRTLWSLQVTHFREVLEVKEARVYRVAGLWGPGALSPEGAEEPWERALEKRMDYRLLPWSGEPMPRNALDIAGILGLPPDILREARKRIGEKSDGSMENKGVGK